MRLQRSSTSPDNPPVFGVQTPRIGTRRVPTVPTKGPQIVALAQLAGIGHDDWQTYIDDVAHEYDPETGRWTHRTNILIVGRQNGKTVVLEDRVLAGLYLFASDRLILHTAQDRAVPRELFESLATRIGDTQALHKRLDTKGIRETNGQERIRLKDGSTYRILAPRPKAFRNWSADVLIFDEAREQRTWELWNAATPTQSARPNPQLWIVSNAGDPDSVVLNTARDRGRRAADNPTADPTVAYFEWSAAPERTVDDEQGWAEANPSYGHRMTRDAVLEELSAARMDDDAMAGFVTERLCRWVDTPGTPAIPFDAWLRCGGEPDEVEPGPPRPVCGIDLDGNRSHAAIAIAAERDGRLVVDVVWEMHDPDGVDVATVAAEALDWMKAYHIRDFAFDKYTGQTVADMLEARGRRPLPVAPVAFVNACSNMHDAVTSGYLLHRNGESLNDQVRRTVRRDRGDGHWFISRKDSTGTISGVLAAVFAVNLAYRPRRTPSVH
jgi:phage terminase large subunit-like protein